jgi:hypothetical protein
MKTFIWLVTAAIAGVWSLLCWGAHVLIGAGGNLVARNADVVPYLPPELVEMSSWLAVVGTSVGEWLVIGIWAIGFAVVLGFGAIGAKLLGRRGVKPNS